MQAHENLPFSVNNSFGKKNVSRTNLNVSRNDTQDKGDEVKRGRKQTNVTRITIVTNPTAERRSTTAKICLPIIFFCSLFEDLSPVHKSDLTALTGIVISWCFSC
jgi:hypothetical protein